MRIQNHPIPRHHLVSRNREHHATCAGINAIRKEVSATHQYDYPSRTVFRKSISLQQSLALLGTHCAVIEPEMYVADATFLYVLDVPKCSMRGVGHQINAHLWDVANLFSQNGGSRKLEILFVAGLLSFKMGDPDRAIAGRSTDRTVALSQDHTGWPF